MNNKNINKKELIAIFNRFYIEDMQDILDFCDVLVVENLKYKKDYVDFLVKFFLDGAFVEKFIGKLNETTNSASLYSYLIWFDHKIDTKLALKLYELKLNDIVLSRNTHINEFKLDGIYALLRRVAYEHWRGRVDYLKIDRKIQMFLRVFYPKPDDYELQEIKESHDTKYSYNNEEGVLSFIHTIQELLQNNLVEFGKTNEKPLLKTLNILKASTNIEEFYTDKKSNTLATDMLTRSFSYYYWQNRKFDSSELLTLKDFISLQFNDQMEFFISRIFTSHLKKVRFDFYYSSQRDMFDVVKLIVNNLVGKNWVSMKNILNFCRYRDLYIHLESSDKTSYYYINSNDDELSAGDYYFEIFYEPLLKACLFYLGALGVLELKYDEPISPYNISADKAPYISVWDSLEYVKLTDLGLYTLGVNKTYEAKEIKKIKKTIKFDEYKPIISINKTDTITIAKLEPYVEKYEDRYILSYSKIFKDCNNHKTLVMKIDAFYKLFDTKPPKVFDNFFDEIKQNANMLKRDLKLITIELKNNKKLLNLFMTNKKLQELTIKAAGYKIILNKDDMAKLTKIVKDNGFFIEF